MNPPFERKYGCMTIVENVLNSVPSNTKCAFILPDKKLEKTGEKTMNRILSNHQLQKIVKLPEKTFSEGITTSIFIFETGVPQNGKEIFTCYISEDGLVTVKNQGRQDINNKWQEIEKYWVEIIYKQSGDDSIKWVKPTESLSYQMPLKEFVITDEDFRKTVLDYLMFQENIDVKTFEENIMNNILYSSSLKSDDNKVIITIENEDIEDEQN